MSESLFDKNKILLFFEIKAYKYLLSKNKSSKQTYYSSTIDNIIFNERTHIVSLFKEYLIIDDDYDFLKRFYSIHESLPRIERASEYYNKYDFFYPNYAVFPQSSLLLNNILLKRYIINNIHCGKKNKEKHKENNDEKDNNNIIFNSSIYDYIINQSNTLSIFDIDKEKDEEGGTINDLNNLINNINNNNTNIKKNNFNGSNDNKIIGRNINSNRTISYAQSNSNKKLTIDENNINLISSKIYKKNISLIKNKNNFFRCFGKTNVKKNSLEKNIQSEEPLNFIYSNKNIRNENNFFSIPKLILKESNSFYNKNNTINYKSIIPYSVNRAEYINKSLYKKNKLIKTDTRTFENKNLAKSISNINFHDNNINPFILRVQTPVKLNKEPQSFYKSFKNNNSLKNKITIKEHLLNKEIQKIKVNTKPNRNCQKTKTQKLLIDLNKCTNNKSQKSFNKKNYNPNGQVFLNKKKNAILYKKKYINCSSNNAYETQVQNDSSSINDILYLQNSTEILNKERHNNSLFKSIYNKTHSPISPDNKNKFIKLNYLLNCDAFINYENTIQNEAPYSKKKILKTKSLNTITGYKRKTNNISSSIENIHKNINKTFKNNDIYGSLSLWNINKQKNSLKCLNLCNVNKCIYNNPPNKTIDNNKNFNMKIFKNIMNREKIIKIYDKSINYTDLNLNDSIGKNKTYINININNNIGINNKNNRSNDPNYFNTEENNNGGLLLKKKKTFNRIKNNNTINIEKNFNSKLQKVKEWRNKQIKEIIRESRLKYIKINNSFNANNDFKMKNFSTVNISNNEGKKINKIIGNKKNVKNSKNLGIRNNNLGNMIIKNKILNKIK